MAVDARLMDEFFLTPPAGRAPSPWRRLVPIALAALLVVSGAGLVLLRSPEQAEAQVFRYAFEQGQSQSYHLTMDVSVRPRGEADDLEPMDIGMEATYIQTVIEANDDGSGVIDVQVTDIRVDPPDPDIPSDLGSMRVTLGPDGSVRGIEGTGGLLALTGIDPAAELTDGSGADPTTTQFFFPQFPDGAIAPGDGWSETVTYPMPFGDDELTVHIDGKLDGYEQTHYGRAARVNYEMDSPMSIDFSMQEIVDAFLELGQAFASEPIPPPPPELRGARFSISGGMNMDAVALVLPETNDLVQLNGTATIAMAFRTQGFPSELGGDEEFAIDATMKMSIVRTS